MASKTAGAETFKKLSAAEFFYRNREIAGFSNPSRALYQTVRELVENSLDATDTHNILPIVKLYIERSKENANHYTITVEDNGVGIPPQYVPSAFGQVLFSSKYVLRQTRGMYGLGAKMAILYGQITTGKPVEVITSPLVSRRIYYFKLNIDIKQNRPIILEQKSWRKNSEWHGTIVSLTIEGDWSRAKQYVYDYIEKTAIAAPYAELVFRDPDGQITRYSRFIEKLPKPPRPVKPHPHGVDIEMLKLLIGSSKTQTLKEFLVESFQAVGDVSAERFLKWAKLDPGKELRKMTIRELENLARKLKEYGEFKPPNALSLSPFGEDIIKAGLRRIFEPDFVTAVSRKPSAYRGHPFIVEVGIAYGGKIRSDKEPQLIRYANKIPLLFDAKSDVAWKVVNPEEFNWKNYLVNLPAPLVVLVHVCSTKIPFKGVGKESIADVPEIEREIKNAVREASRRLRRFLSRKKRQEEMKRRMETFLKYVPEVSRSLATLMGGDGSESTIRGLLLEIIKKHVGLEEEQIHRLESMLAR